MPILTHPLTHLSTLLASSFMTLSSLPFFYDWAMAGGDVLAVRTRADIGELTFERSTWAGVGLGSVLALGGLAVVVNRAFQAYLIWCVFSSYFVLFYI